MRLIIFNTLLVLSSVSFAQTIKTGFYTTPTSSNCSLHVASYPQSQVVVVKVSDSIDGIICEQKKEVVPFTCDGKNKCISENGNSTLYILSPNQFLISMPGSNTEYAFAATQIPVANKFLLSTFDGWTYSFWRTSSPTCRLANKTEKFCMELTIDDITSEKVCEQGLQQSAKLVPQKCQNMGFKSCQVINATTTPVFHERVPLVEGTIDFPLDSFRTGCSIDHLVQGVR